MQAGTINPILLHPTETLRVTFDTLPLTDCFVGPCDVLLVFIPFLSHPPDLAITAKLFDGSDLLGTYTSTTLLPSFTSPTSVFAFDSANIDFTNVVNGTLDGVLDLTVSAPVYVNAYEASEEFEPNTQYFIAVSHATDIRRGSGWIFSQSNQCHDGSTGTKHMAFPRHGPRRPARLQPQSHYGPSSIAEGQQPPVSARSPHRTLMRVGRPGRRRVPESQTAVKYTVRFGRTTLQKLGGSAWRSSCLKELPRRFGSQ